MDKLTGLLLGPPRVLLNDEVVNLPFKQAEALLYYLLVEHEVSRSKAADLIWGSHLDERKAKSNMRNAIYVLRRAFFPDFLVEPQKNILRINPRIAISLDVEQLKAPGDSVPDSDPGEFLQEFYLKENEYFNEWIQSTRQELKQIYMERLKQAVESSFRQKNWSACEDQAKRLVALDEYDEDGYYYLMEIYRMRGEYHKGLSLYERLRTLLAEDLFQFPGEKIARLTEQMKRERKQTIQVSVQPAARPGVAEPEKTPIFGRSAEQKALVENALHFLNGGVAVSQVVIGEAGIGKTTLLDHLCKGLQTGGNVFLFRASCYHAEESFALKPWQTVFEAILNSMKQRSMDSRDTYFRFMAGQVFPHLAEAQAEPIDQDLISVQAYDGSERAITHTVLRFAKDRKVVLCLDDLQWADPVTVSLIQDILTANQNRNILFVLGCRGTHPAYVSRFLEDMRLARFLREVALERFGFEDTVALADLLLPRQFESSELRKQLYYETEGNPFFIIETVNNFKYNGALADITQNMRDTIRQRTMLLSTDERTILDLLSLFFDGASFELLQELSRKPEYELMDLLDTLMDKQLICEKSTPEGVCFQFTHQKILEYVYSELSMTKRRVFHERVAVCLEQKLTGTGRDFPVYHRLMYHFERAKNQKKYLKYCIKYVYTLLNRAHEYYPVVSEGPWLGTASRLSPDSADSSGISGLLQRIEELVKANEGSFDQQDRQDYLSDYYHMMGRYYIRVADYDRGLAYIQKLVEFNQPIDSEQCRKNLIKANRQKICVYMNRYEPEPMRELVQASIQLLTGHSKPEEMAIWNRLHGMSDIMTGDLTDSQQQFVQAIDIFEHSMEKEQYRYNLAASYAGLGEAKRMQGDYEGALSCYEEAIANCKDYRLSGSAATFYTYAGQAAVDSGDLDQAEEYLSKAVECFNKIELLWERGIAFSYFGRLHVLRGRYQEALTSLIIAKRCSEQLGSRYELGVLNRIFAQIAVEMEQNPELRAVFSEYVTCPPETYVERARDLLAPVYSPVDEAYLRQVEEQNAR